MLLWSYHSPSLMKSFSSSHCLLNKIQILQYGWQGSSLSGSWASLSSSTLPNPARKPKAWAQQDTLQFPRIRTLTGCSFWTKHLPGFIAWLTLLSPLQVAFWRSSLTDLSGLGSLLCPLLRRRCPPLWDWRSGAGLYFSVYIHSRAPSLFR